MAMTISARLRRLGHQLGVESLQPREVAGLADGERAEVGVIATRTGSTWFRLATLLPLAWADSGLLVLRR